MTLQIEDVQSGTTLELYNAQTLSNERDAQVDAAPPTGTDSDEAFLSSLEQSGNVTIQGAVTGLRLSRTAGYSSDPETALAEWLVQYETFINGAPGEGHRLTRDYRNDSLRGIPDQLSWTVRGGEVLEAGYSLSVQRGTGLSVHETPSPDSVSPGGDFVVNGRTLESFTEMSVTKQQDLESTRRSFADSPDENDITTTAGATRRITITGQVEGTVAERNQFDADITDGLGQDEIIDVRDAITGRTISGMVTAFSATDEAGLARLNEFAVEVVDGVTEE